MANKPPAFLWYPKDFEADEDAACMSLAERGAYITLLGYCWMEGSIPDDVEKLARLCRCGQGEMRRIWPVIRGRFNIEVIPGRLSNPRLERERDALKAKSEGGRAAASVRWQHRKSHADRVAGAGADARETHMRNSCESDADASKNGCERNADASDTPRVPRASPPAPGAPAPGDRARGFRARPAVHRASADALRTQCGNDASQSQLQSQYSTSTTTSEAETQTAEWLREAARELTGREWPPPDPEISRRVLAAAKGELEGLGDYLAGLVRAGRKEFRSYAWFETVVSNQFGGHDANVA